LLTLLLVDCAADVPHDGPDAVCSQRDGPGCQSSSSEYAEDEAAMSLLQTQIKVEALKAEPSEDMKDTCSQKLVRFNSLDNQATWTAGNDPMFPPVYSSIAAPGVKCGDSAQGISNSCAGYNHWKTFQQVSQQIKKPFAIIGPSGISFDDIEQGALGNCYFLSALASIANQDPKIIEDMFVERDLWSQNIFKTKWLLNGKQTTMAVDNMIPAGDGNTYFTHGSPTGEWWPVVLAKTWAKIFGSYKLVEGGSAITVIAAITQSPFHYYYTAKTTEAEAWKILEDATRNNHPMNAGTGKITTNGLADGHAYAVLGVKSDPTYGNVVKCYNPWGSDNYKGAIPNTVEVNGPKPGVFTMKLAEFMKAFDAFSFNYVSSAYKAKTLSGIKAGRHVFELSVSQPGMFWVSLDYPTDRMTEPCATPHVVASLKGELTAEKGKALGTGYTSIDGEGMNTYEFPGTTAGKYLIVVDLKFAEDSATYLDKFAVSVYAPGDVTLTESSVPAEDVELELNGPLDANGKTCSIITDPSFVTYYLDKTKIVGGVPTYWTEDKQAFTYYWSPADKWNEIESKEWSEVVAGEGWQSKQVAKGDFKCGQPKCQDRPGGITGFGAAIPCNQATDTNYKYSNVKCTGAEYSSYVQKFCKFTCGLCPGQKPR